MMKKLGIGILWAALSLPAVTIDFDCLTDNGNGCATMVPQLTVEVTDPGSGQVKFSFSNAGPIASVVAEIYWDDYNDAMYLGGFAVPTFATTDSISFVTGANPPNLPSGQNAIPAFAADFAAQAANPAPQNGINPGEGLDVFFLLGAGRSFDDVLDALSNGDLRIGMHVTGIGTAGGSDAVLNTPPELPPPTGNVPEPATYALMGAGLAALGFLRRKAAR